MKPQSSCRTPSIALDKMQADDVRDPRVRSFVYPVRIVWQTTGEQKDDGWPMRCETQKAELLLKRKRGQVCEGPFGSSCGTRLVNRGEPPGVLLDFGRELHGGLSLGMSPSTTAGARLRLRFGESVSETMSELKGTASTFSARLVWVSITPLLFPVVPEVNIIVATSSG